MEQWEIPIEGCIKKEDTIICRFGNKKLVIDRDAIRVMDLEEKYGINIHFDRDAKKELLIDFRNFALYDKIPEDMLKKTKKVRSS